MSSKLLNLFLLAWEAHVVLITESDVSPTIKHHELSITLFVSTADYTFEEGVQELNNR